MVVAHLFKVAAFDREFFHLGSLDVYGVGRALLVGDLEEENVV